MTVPAIDPVIAHMVLMTELHRLRTHHILPRKIGRTRKTHHPGQCQSCQEYPCEETKPGDEIRAAVKNLGHVLIALWRVSMKGAGPGESTLSYRVSAGSGSNCGR